MQQITEKNGVIITIPAGATFGEAPKPLPSQITLTGVTGDIEHASDFSKITCDEQTNIIISGTVDIPVILQHRVIDGVINITMPICCPDGTLIYFGVDVTNGEFSATLNFPSSGKYRYSSVEANEDLPDGTFSVSTISINVRRKIV